MMFLKSAALFGLVASVYATPVPQDSSTDLAKRLAEVEEAVYTLINEKREAEVDFAPNLNHLEARAQIKDTKCPDSKKTFKKGDIAEAVKKENNKANPDEYKNLDHGGLFKGISGKMYKARLDSKL
jgi:hypothetical protein